MTTLREYQDQLLVKALELRNACEQVLQDPTLFYMLTRDEARNVSLALAAGRNLWDKVACRDVPDPDEHINIDEGPNGQFLKREYPR